MHASHTWRFFAVFFLSREGGSKIDGWAARWEGVCFDTVWGADGLVHLLVARLLALLIPPSLASLSRGYRFGWRVGVAAGSGCWRGGAGKGCFLVQKLF
jgi:hypothetical protein